jgi:hypothetical protein
MNTMTPSSLGLRSDLQSAISKSTHPAHEENPVQSIFLCIQAEDRAIRERGRCEGGSLIRELLYFFAIQMAVLSFVLLYTLA